MAIDLSKLNQDKLDALARTFVTEFADTEKLRQQKEIEWLESLRQCKGLHDPDIAFKKSDSKMYAQYTRSKEVPLRAKLNQHLLPEKEKNWEISPTDKPSVDEAALQEIVTSLIKQNPETGQPELPTDTEIDTAIYKYTEERAKKMSTLISDELAADDYRQKQKEQIKSGIRYGLGVIKGPMTESYTVNETVHESGGATHKMLDYIKGMFGGMPQGQGTWKQIQATKYRPVSQFTPIWNFFPDMTAIEFGKCNFVYELNSMTKHELRGLAKRGDFLTDSIIEILKASPDGNYKLRSWENTLQTLDANSEQKITTKNYEVLERNGYIDGSILFDSGIIKEEDVENEVFCNVWICGGKIIKVLVWPEKVMATLTDLYHLFYYERDETSVFGTGLPRIIRDRQLAINAGERHLLNHAAWLVGPCGEINLSLLHPDSAATASDFGPLKFYGKVGYGNDANSKVLNLYHIEDRVGSLVNLLSYQKTQGDAESSLPSYLFGSPSAGGGDETAKGISVRFSNLIDFIKDLAKNFDEANTSYTYSIYKWNMEFHPDDTVKGDMDIKAIGSAQALVKDAIGEQLSFFLQSMPEGVYPYIKWAEFAKEIGKVFFDNPDKFLLTDEEVEKNQAPMMAKQAEMEALQNELAKIKGDYDMAKAENLRAKAKIGAEKLIIDKAKVLADIGEKQANAERQERPTGGD